MNVALVKRLQKYWFGDLVIVHRTSMQYDDDIYYARRLSL